MIDRKTMYSSAGHCRLGVIKIGQQHLWNICYGQSTSEAWEKNQHGPYSIYDNADERMKWQGAGGIMNSCRLWAGKESSRPVGFTATVREKVPERKERGRETVGQIWLSGLAVERGRVTDKRQAVPSHTPTPATQAHARAHTHTAMGTTWLRCHRRPGPISF